MLTPGNPAGVPKNKDNMLKLWLEHMDFFGVFSHLATVFTLSVSMSTQDTDKAYVNNNLTKLYSDKELHFSGKWVIPNPKWLK